MNKPLPEGLPPLPQGAVYLGKGGEFRIPDCEFKGWTANENPKYSRWSDNEGRTLEGDISRLHYAAPADSEIARLNGLSPDSGLPFGLTWDSPELEGINYVAYDKCGILYGYESKPAKAGHRWSRTRGRYFRIDNPNWHNSLAARPKPEPECAGKLVEIDGKRFRLVPVEDHRCDFKGRIESE